VLHRARYLFSQASSAPRQLRSAGHVAPRRPGRPIGFSSRSACCTEASSLACACAVESASRLWCCERTAAVSKTPVGSDSLCGGSVCSWFTRRVQAERAALNGIVREECVPSQHQPATKTLAARHFRPLIAKNGAPGRSSSPDQPLGIIRAVPPSLDSSVVPGVAESGGSETSA
jgi:hypothetical protein